MSTRKKNRYKANLPLGERNKMLEELDPVSVAIVNIYSFTLKKKKQILKHLMVMFTKDTLIVFDYSCPLT